MIKSLVERTRLRLNPLRVVVALLFLVALAGATLLLGTRYAEVGVVRVPDVTGQNVAEASRTLERLGFEVSTYPDTARTAGTVPGGVTDQTPDAGALVRRGRGVALGVERSGNATVPRLVGLSQTDAEAALASTDLVVATLNYRHAPRPAGTVLAQHPGAGPAATQSVQLTVSLGPRTRRVALPRVVGRPLRAARQQLRALGFRRVEAVPTRLGSVGVTAQRPPAGTRVSVSAPVTLLYTVAHRQVVPVPPVVGLELSRAAERLQAAGLRVGQVVADPYDPARARGVSAVQPGGHTLWGTAVALRTNGEAGTFEAGVPAPPPAAGTRTSPRPGPERPTVRLTPAPTLTPTLPRTGGRDIPVTLNPANYAFLQGRAYELRVEVTDAEGTREVLRRMVAPDEPVDTTVTVYGETELRMYLDGQIVLAYNPPNP